MRARVIAVVAGLVILVVLFFVFPFRSNQDKIGDLRDQQEQTQQEITRLRAELARLLELQKRDPQLRAELARLDDALPNDPRVPDFILQVQDAATLAGIDFLSISPSVPGAFAGEGGTGGLLSISVAITAEGRYFELEDFIIRMEQLRRAVRIDRFSLAPGGDDQDTPGGLVRPRSPLLAVTFQMQMFMLSQAPVPTTPQTPGATPAPGETPAPSASPDPAATPGNAPTPVPQADAPEPPTDERF